MRRVRIGVFIAVWGAGCDLAEESDTDTDTMTSADATSGDGETPAGAYCDDVASWGSTMVELEEEVLVLVNEARAAGASCGGQPFAPSAPVTMNGALRCAARVHSQDMFDRDFFSHDNPDGEDPFVRMERAGYDFVTAGENIAAGQTSAGLVMQGWMNSPGHCSNIMNPAFTEIGVGVFMGSGGSFPIYWTQTFGAR